MYTGMRMSVFSDGVGCLFVLYEHVEVHMSYLPIPDCWPCLYLIIMMMYYSTVMHASLCKKFAFAGAFGPHGEVLNYCQFIR